MQITHEENSQFLVIKHTGGGGSIRKENGTQTWLKLSVKNAVLLFSNNKYPVVKRVCEIFLPNTLLITAPIY